MKRCIYVVSKLIKKPRTKHGKFFASYLLQAFRRGPRYAHCTLSISWLNNLKWHLTMYSLVTLHSFLLPLSFLFQVFTMLWKANRSRSHDRPVGDSSHISVGRDGGRIQSEKCDLERSFDSNYKLRLSLSDSIAQCNKCFNSGGGSGPAHTAFNEI